MEQANIHSKKTRAKSRRLEQAKKKVQRKSKNKKKAESFNFAALHLLNDPQGLSFSFIIPCVYANDRMVL